MANVYTGHDGVVTIADTGDSLSAGTAGIGNLRNFTIEQTQDTIETTTMSAGGTTGTGMRTYQPGLSTWTITGDVYFDHADAYQIKLDELVSKTGQESVANIVAYPSGSGTSQTPANCSLTGDCIITSWSITSAVDGVVEASFSAQGTGSLTYAAI